MKSLKHQYNSRPSSVVENAGLMVTSYENNVLESMGEIPKEAKKRPRTKVNDVEEEEEEPEVKKEPLRNEAVAAVQGLSSTGLASQQEFRVCEPNMEGKAPGFLRMPDFINRDNPQALILSHLKNVGRTADEVIANIPPMKDVMSFIASMESDQQPAWFRSFPKQAINMGLELPVLEVVTPEYVQLFLREVDPDHAQWERPCRPPINLQTGLPLTCESVLMGGPVLREFLLPSQYKALLKSPYFSQTSSDRSLTLPKDVRPCFLCCQRSVSVAYGQRKYPETKRAEGQELGEEEEDYVIIHDYIMSVGHVGGYDISLVLPGFSRAMGIAGPILEHDRLHYVPHRHCEGKLGGWLQKDEMFFRDGVM
jgi:hypothetical protein